MLCASVKTNITLSLNYTNNFANNIDYYSLLVLHTRFLTIFLLCCWLCSLHLSFVCWNFVIIQYINFKRIIFGRWFFSSCDSVCVGLACLYFWSLSLFLSICSVDDSRVFQRLLCFFLLTFMRCLKLFTFSPLYDLYI